RRPGNGGSPLIRAHVASMPRKEPMMAGEIFGPVLTLAILSLMQVLDNPSAHGFRSFEMAIHILEEHRQALSSISQLRGTCTAGPSSIEHDPRLAQIHLCSVRRAAGFAIAVVFSEPERFGQPVDGFSDVRITNVWQQSVRGYRAIRNHRACLLFHDTGRSVDLYCKKASS